MEALVLIKGHMLTEFGQDFREVSVRSVLVWRCVFRLFNLRIDLTYDLSIALTFDRSSAVEFNMVLAISIDKLVGRVLNHLDQDEWYLTLLVFKGCVQALSVKTLLD